MATVFTTHHIDARHEDLTNRHDSENGDEHLAILCDRTTPAPPKTSIGRTSLVCLDNLVLEKQIVINYHLITVYHYPLDIAQSSLFSQSSPAPSGPIRLPSMSVEVSQCHTPGSTGL